MIHSSVRGPVILATLCAPLAGCGRDTGVQAGVALRDSAGVRIVESAAPAWTEAQTWRVEGEPVLDVGAAEGEAAFHRVTDVVRLSDGRIVVADAGARELRWFDASGRPLARAGRRGGGPGEFIGIDWIGALPGDSVAVWDGAAGALTVFGPDGRQARRVKPAPLALGAEVLGVLADGTLVATAGLAAGPRPPSASGFHRDTVTWLALSPDAARARRLGRHAGREMYGGKVGSMWMGATPPGGRNVHFAAAPGGYWAGDDARFDVAFYDARGRLRRRVRRPYEMVRVTARDISADADKQVVAPGVPGLGESLRRLQQGMLRDLPRDQAFAAYGRLLADSAGWLWVAEHRPALQPAARWSVFDPGGRWMGEVRVPAGLDVRQVGPGWVLGIAADQMDVQHVRLHRIHKPAQGPRDP